MKNSNFIPVGYRIKAKEIRCIDQTNNNLGVVDIKEGLRLASEAGLDLVQITPIQNKEAIPVCKILDFSKYKYDLSKKEKETAKKQRESAIKIKEIKFRPATADNDLKIKATQAEKFINEGSRVKISILHKGREMSHTQLGYDTLNKFLSMVPNMEFTSQPSMSGRFLSVMCGKKQEK